MGINLNILWGTNLGFLQTYKEDVGNLCSMNFDDNLGGSRTLDQETHMEIRTLTQNTLNPPWSSGVQGSSIRHIMQDMLDEPNGIKG